MPRQKLPRLLPTSNYYSVFENLIGNSIRHNPNGCSIFIDARVADLQYQITIQDDGQGFPDQVLRSLRTASKPQTQHHVMA